LDFGGKKGREETAFYGFRENGEGGMYFAGVYTMGFLARVYEFSLNNKQILLRENY